MVAFRLSVIGEKFRRTPDVFDWAADFFRAEIERWGYQSSRADYEAALRAADVVVSTAEHEFFGLSVVEAIAAGAYPLLPRRLSYPEILGDFAGVDAFFYGGGPAELAERLEALANRAKHDALWSDNPQRGVDAVERFVWRRRGPDLDGDLEQLR